MTLDLVIRAERVISTAGEVGRLIGIKDGTIVAIEPGGVIPFPETHVMEHGLYVLEGKAVYLLNNDWVEVQEGRHATLGRPFV